MEPTFQKRRTQGTAPHAKGRRQQKRFFNPIKFAGARRLASSSSTPHPRLLPPGIFRVPSLPSSLQCSSQLGSPAGRQGLRRGQRCPALSSGRRHLEEFLRGKPWGQLRCASAGWPLCAKGTLGPGAGERRPSGILDLAAVMSKLT